jgi:aspartate racemase
MKLSSEVRGEATGHAIGIVTGSGPEAGLDLWAKILNANRAYRGSEFRGDLDAPRVHICSSPLLGLSMDMQTHEAAVWRELRGILQRMDDLASYICISCYTLHVFEPRIRALNLHAEFVSLIDVVTEHLKSTRPDRVGLLTAGAIPPAECPLQVTLRQHFEVEVVANTSRVRRLVFAIKSMGPADPGVIREYEEVLSDLESHTIVLGCSELPLVPVDARDRDLVDGTALLAQTLVRKVFPRQTQGVQTPDSGRSESKWVT